MEKYLIMTDLDGTLLNKKSKISRKSIRKIKKIVKAGHYFIFATGRPYQGCIKYYNQLGIDSPLVCDNGGSIHFPHDHSKDIFTSIPLELFIDLLKDIKPYIYSGMSSNFDTIYYYNRKEVPMFIQHLTPPRTIIEGDLDKIIKTPPINPILFIKNENFYKVIDILKKDKYSSINYRYWIDFNDKISLELFNKEATKGYALIKLKKLLNIKNENDLVFGDQLNDLEMIKAAYNGVAMINGKEELKQIAKYTSYKPNYKNGVVHFINKFFRK